MTDPTSEPAPRTPVPPWWLRFALGAVILGYEVSPWNPGEFRYSVAIIALGVMGVLSFVKVDLAEMVRGMLPQPPPPSELPTPPSPSGAPPGPPELEPHTDEETTP